MLPKKSFLKLTFIAHEKYRKVRYEQLREVTNAVWVAEALCNLGFQVTPDDSRVKAALNVFFQDFIDTLELREGAKKLIKQAQGTVQSSLNLKLHLCASHLQKPTTVGNKHVLQCGCDFGRKRLAETKQPHIPRRPKQATGPSERSSLHRRQPNRRHQRRQTSRTKNSLCPLTV